VYAFRPKTNRSFAFFTAAHFRRSSKRVPAERRLDRPNGTIVREASGSATRSSRRRERRRASVSDHFIQVHVRARHDQVSYIHTGVDTRGNVLANRETVFPARSAPYGLVDVTTLDQTCDHPASGFHGRFSESVLADSSAKKRFP